VLKWEGVKVLKWEGVKVGRCNRVSIVRFLSTTGPTAMQIRPMKSCLLVCLQWWLSWLPFGHVMEQSREWLMNATQYA